MSDSTAYDPKFGVNLIAFHAAGAETTAMASPRAYRVGSPDPDSWVSTNHRAMSTSLVLVSCDALVSMRNACNPLTLLRAINSPLA